MGLFGFFSTLICCTSFESFRLSLVLESLRENVKGRKQEGKVKKKRQGEGKHRYKPFSKKENRRKHS